MIFFLFLSFLLVIWLLIKNKQNRLDNKIWFLWVSFLFLSTLFANRLLPGLVGDGYRHQGVIFFLILGIWTIAFNLQTKTDLKKIVVVQSPFENRWLIWQLGFKAALEKPLLGYGAEGIISAYDQQYQKIDRSLLFFQPFGVVHWFYLIFLLT